MMGSRLDSLQLLRQIANAVMIFVADLKNLTFHLNVVVLVDTRQRVLDS